MKCNHKTPDKMVGEQRVRWAYRRRLVRIGAMLVVAIALLDIIQWQIGIGGWDLSAGLLTIVMMALGLGLGAIFLGILRGRLLTDEDPTTGGCQGIIAILLQFLRVFQGA